MKAVILAAGKGTRMGPLTKSRPKVMQPIANKPILEHIILALKVAGIRDFLIVVGHHKERIKDHFENGSRLGVAIEYIEQQDQLGTADAIRTVRNRIETSNLSGTEERFLVTNGDVLAGVSDIKKIIYEMKSVRDHVIEFIELFFNSDFKLEHKTKFVSLATRDYSFYEGVIEDSKGFCILEDKYWDYLNRIVIPYSEATGYSFEGEEYMVGALARMNINKTNLHLSTKTDASKFLSVFPSINVYHNNLAQAIEILHCIDHSIDILESSEFKEERNEPVTIKEGEGVGILEAPRGTLYYMLSIDKTGKVQYGNIIVPTQQNQIAMEKTIVQTVEENIGKEKKKVEYEIEKLIRAYDPCMSCASHFLRINWRE